MTSSVSWRVGRNKIVGFALAHDEYVVEMKPASSERHLFGMKSAESFTFRMRLGSPSRISPISSTRPPACKAV